MMFQPVNFIFLRAATLFVLSSALADNVTITYNPSWDFQCAPAGQNSTATFRLKVDTNAFSNYTIQTNVMWGDHFAIGKGFDLPVGVTHELVFQYAFEVVGSGREHVKMVTKWIAPEEALIFPKDPMSEYAQIVDISEEECILVETASPSASFSPTSTPSPTSSSDADLTRSLLALIINVIFISVAFFLS